MNDRPRIDHDFLPPPRVDTRVYSVSVVVFWTLVAGLIGYGLWLTT